jgi:hypothetical protein
VHAYRWAQSVVSRSLSNLNQKALDPFRRAVTQNYKLFKSGASQTRSRFSKESKDITTAPTVRKQTQIGAVFSLVRSKLSKGLELVRNRLAPTYLRFQRRSDKALSKFKRNRKRKLNALGKVVGFASQEIQNLSPNVTDPI